MKGKTKTSANNLFFVVFFFLSEWTKRIVDKANKKGYNPDTRERKKKYRTVDNVFQLHTNRFVQEMVNKTKTTEKKTETIWCRESGKCPYEVKQKRVKRKPKKSEKKHTIFLCHPFCQHEWTKFTSDRIHVIGEFVFLVLTFENEKDNKAIIV